MKSVALAYMLALIFLAFSATTIPCLAFDQTTSANEVMASLDEAAAYV